MPIPQGEYHEMLNWLDDIVSEAYGSTIRSVNEGVDNSEEVITYDMLRETQARITPDYRIRSSESLINIKESGIFMADGMSYYVKTVSRLGAVRYLTEGTMSSMVPYIFSTLDAAIGRYSRFCQYSNINIGDIRIREVTEVLGG